MTDLTDDYILDMMREAVKTEFEPQFSLHYLVGKTIQAYRQVKNPKEYDTTRENPNPEYFDVLVFFDTTFLAAENWGDGECGHVNYYYHDGQRTLYSDQLFGLL